MFYWFLKRIVLGPVLRLIFRPYVIGLENVPEDGGAILASNHLSFSDSIFLPLVVERRVTFLAKADYFTGRGLKGRLTAVFFRGVGQLPVDRAGGSASEAALQHRAARSSAAATSSASTPRAPARPTAGSTAARPASPGWRWRPRCPVLPVAMIDTEKIQPPGRKRPKLGIRVGINIGKPLDFSRYEGMEGDRFVLRSITDEIMYELMDLSGQEYVDIYAQVAKDRLKAEKAERDKKAAAAADIAPAASDDQGGHAPPPESAGSPVRPTGCRIAPWVSRRRSGARWRCSARSACSTPSSSTHGATTSTCTRSAAGSCSG